jgi:hypothetical protein
LLILEIAEEKTINKMIGELNKEKAELEIREANLSGYSLPSRGKRANHGNS